MTHLHPRYFQSIQPMAPNDPSGAASRDPESFACELFALADEFALATPEPPLLRLQIPALGSRLAGLARLDPELCDALGLAWFDAEPDDAPHGMKLGSSNLQMLGATASLFARMGSGRPVSEPFASWSVLRGMERREAMLLDPEPSDANLYSLWVALTVMVARSESARLALMADPDLSWRGCDFLAQHGADWTWGGSLDDDLRASVVARAFAERLAIERTTHALPGSSRTRL